MLPNHLNAATAKVNGAGYYHFAPVWQAIGGNSVVPTEPWNIQGSNTAATAKWTKYLSNGNVAFRKLITDPARPVLTRKRKYNVDAQNFAGTRYILNMNDSSYYNLRRKPANSNNGESQAKSRTYNMLSYYNTRYVWLQKYSRNDTPYKAGGKLVCFPVCSRRLVD